MDWKPISEAKRDGTEYIGRLGPKDMRLIWYFTPSSRSQGWLDAHSKPVFPTHFIDKPEDPPPGRDPKYTIIGIDRGHDEWNGCVCPRCHTPHRWKRRTPKQCRACDLPFQFSS